MNILLVLCSINIVFGIVNTFLGALTKNWQASTGWGCSAAGWFLVLTYTL